MTEKPPTDPPRAVQYGTDAAARLMSPRVAAGLAKHADQQRERDLCWQVETTKGGDAIKWAEILRKFEHTAREPGRKLPAALDFPAGHYLSDAEAARLAAYGDAGLERIWDLCASDLTAATIFKLVGVHSKSARGRKAEAYADARLDAWAALREWDPAKGGGVFRTYLAARVKQAFQKRRRDDRGGLVYKSATDAPEEARGDNGKADPRAVRGRRRQSFIASDAPPSSDFEGDAPEFLDYLIRDCAEDPFDAAWREFARDYRHEIEETLTEAVSRMRTGKRKEAIRTLLLPLVGPEYDRANKATAPLLREFAERQGVDTKTVKNWLAEGVEALRPDPYVRKLERIWRDYWPTPASVPYNASRW